MRRRQGKILQDEGTEWAKAWKFKRTKQFWDTVNRFLWLDYEVMHVGMGTDALDEISK